MHGPINIKHSTFSAIFVNNQQRWSWATLARLLFRPISVSVSFGEELRCHDVWTDSRLEFLTPDRIPIRTLSLCLVPGRRHYGYGCSGNSVSLNVRDRNAGKFETGIYGTVNAIEQGSYAFMNLDQTNWSNAAEGIR